MGRIQLLPPHLVSQIAAGEVIERPASVVKELIENSLDAEANCIEVRVKKGGIERIEVVDDGIGIEKEDLKLALAHHATSKIQKTEDLFKLETFGFRGEALPSIASIARLALISRPRGYETAWKIECQNGRLSERVPTPHPEGTRVVVEDLFYTVPARRKFLRTPRTELSHIVTWLHRFVLGHFEVEFLLIEGKRKKWHFPPGEPAQRLALIFGGEFAERALAIEVEAKGLFRLSGWLAPEGVETRSSEGIQQFWFVNRRPVREKQLYRALREAYETAGMSPSAAVLYLEVSPDAVDVNVHPAKLEVRFREGQRLYERLVEVLTQSLRKQPKISSFDPNLFVSPAETPKVSPTAAKRAFDRPAPFHARPQVAESVAFYEAHLPLKPQVSGFWIEERYWIGERDEDIVVVDVEAVRRQMAEEAIGRLGQQPLVLPLCLDISEETATLVEIAREVVAATTGIELERIGSTSVAVRSLPPWLPEEKASAALSKLIEQLQDFSEEQLHRWAVSTAASLLEVEDWFREAKLRDEKGEWLWRSLTAERLAQLFQRERP